MLTFYALAHDFASIISRDQQIVTMYHHKAKDIKNLANISKFVTPTPQNINFWYLNLRSNTQQKDVL